MIHYYHLEDYLKKRKKKMQTFKKLNVSPPLLLALQLFFISTSATSTFCGKIPIQIPFLDSNDSISSILSHLVQCRSEKLYLRTSLGLFSVSSINYTAKTITISHSPCSSSSHFTSPAILSGGFPSPSTPNSLLLYNCSSKNLPLAGNCSGLKMTCAASSEKQDQQLNNPNSCLLVNDVEKLEKGFHPKDLNCSHYSQVYKSDEYNEYELGTRMSFDIPDHVPDICNECNKPNGNCGVGLRCMCHPVECKDKVISVAGSVKQCSNNVFISLLSLTVAFVFFMNF